MMAHWTLIADFNVDLLARYLRVAGETVAVAPYGQVVQSLASGNADPASTTFLWGRAEAVLPTWSRALAMEPVDLEACLGEVDALAGFVLAHAERRRHVFVASFALPPGHRGYGILDWQPGLGLSYALARLNQRWAERLAAARNVHLLDSERWCSDLAKPALPKMWYAAKVPYANAVFQRVAADLRAADQALTGRSRRLVVLDLDNTLWGGIVGETGWQGIRLGGHDHVGEAFRDFQTELKALTRRGIQLAIASKNDESVALEAIDNHPEMVLRRPDFAGWRINWGDKAQNLADLVQEINLGLASVVFVDDNPAERDRVRTALPEVLVPDWPEDPSGYVSALRALDCFDVATLSAEDRSRSAMYAAERERRQVRERVSSAEDWLASLGTTVHVAPLDSANLPRVAQLLNKTNQLNLATRRMSEKELLEWAAGPNRVVLAISVSDRFGDLGLTGVLSLEAQRDEGILVDYLLSCRVMGRKVEETMLALAMETLGHLGAKRMVGRYVPTARNRPTLDVFRGAGLEEPEEHVFVASAGYPMPASVVVTRTSR